MKNLVLKCIGPVEQRTVQRKDGSGTFTVREQPFVLIDGSEYPDKCKVRVPDDSTGYTVGKMYTLGRDSVEINRYGELRIAFAPALYEVSSRSLKGIAGAAA